LAVRRAQSISWRFAESIDQLPLVALFVRDTLRLEVPAGGVIPPRLEGEVPDHSSLLAPVRRDAAGTGWTGWWQEVLARAGRLHLHHPGTRAAGLDLVAWARQMAVEHRELDAAYPPVFDPPEFAGLADRPALRQAVRVTFGEALRWADTQRRSLLFLPARPAQFDSQLVPAEAEQTAGLHRVDLGQVRACAVVVPVRGAWWHRFAPGAVVCSVHAARDPAVAHTIITDAFESGLAS